MPTPYGGGGYGGNAGAYLGALATYGSQGATPAAPVVVEALNAADVVLSGTFQTIATLAPLFVGITGKVVVSVSVTVVNTTAPGSNGDLHVQVQSDGASQTTQDIVATCDVNGAGTTASYTLVITPTNGNHTLRIQAKGVGDAAFTVKAGMGTLVAVAYNS